MADSFPTGPTRQDMLLIERALNRRWNLAPKLRDLAARWINEVLSHPEAYNERTVARAVSLAQAADRLDLDIDKFAVDHLDKHADEDSGAVKIIDKDFWNSVEE